MDVYRTIASAPRPVPSAGLYVMNSAHVVMVAGIAGFEMFNIVVYLDVAG